jgi:hypothetical protein
VVVVEGTFWPLIFVGAEAEPAARREGVRIVDEDQLAGSDGLLIAIIVAGDGEASVRAQRVVLEWLRGHQEMLTARTLRLAWVVEDEAVRSCTDAWLKLTGHALLSARSATFRSIDAAVSWLLDVPCATEPLAASEMNRSA